jgi:hypothetical protein
MKKWILNWLGLGPKQAATDSAVPLSLHHTGGQLIPGQRSRNFFEIIPAINGKIVVYNRQKFNPNGPDHNDMEVYLVHDGDNLMDTITTAIVSAGLK